MINMAGYAMMVLYFVILIGSTIKPARMKISLLKTTVICFSILLGTLQGYAQSCAIDRVPGSSTMPQGGGQTYQFAIVRNGNCTPIFSVSASWLTYSYQSGLLRIFATANPGPPRTGYVYVDNKESLKITITQAGSNVVVTGVSVSPASAFLNINESRYLSANILPSNATNKSVQWSTSSSDVATVNSAGMVTGVSAGTATIKATTVDGGYQANSAITVSAMEKSFSWKNKNGNDYTTPAKDQQTQGPCFLFAAVGAIEAKYKIAYSLPNAVIDLSEGQANIVCLSQPESIPAVFTFSQNNGIVNESCYPYNRSIYGGGISPFPNCLTPCASPQFKMKISGFTCIDFAAIAVHQRSDYLKNAIKQNGPVAVSFSGSSLHGGAMHAYEVYGWNESTWLMKDSWPGAATSNLQTTVNIPDILATNQSNFKACYVGGINSTNGRIGTGVEDDISGQRAVESPDPGLYPNPANDEITLGDLPPDGGLVQLYRSNGAIVFSNRVQSNRLDVSDLPTGTYFIKVTGDKKIKVLKFIKR